MKGSISTITQQTQPCLKLIVSRGLLRVVRLQHLHEIVVLPLPDAVRLQLVVGQIVFRFAPFPAHLASFPIFRRGFDVDVQYVLF